MIRSLLLAATALCLSAPAAMAQVAAPTAAPTAAPAPVPAGKLTDAARPVAYRLDLSVDPASDRFSGHVEIDAVLKQGGSTLDLHGRDLAMRAITARSADGKLVSASWVQSDPTGVGRLTFAQPLPAGPVTLSFDYDSAFGTGPAGLFHVKVGDDWYAWTQFESIDARAAFPGFDEPGFKVPFTVTLRTPKGLTAISNAPEQGSSEAGGLTVHRFAPTLPLPSYLVAMMVGPFAAVQGEVPPTPQRAAPLPLRIVSTRQNSAKLGYALEHSKPIVALLEKYFDQPFPYPKLDQITSPVMPGAMENAGADLYADPILVLDDAATTGQKRTFGMVVAHELSHQWFGDLVTPAWWDDIWLNESFANWMGFRIGDEWKPELNIKAGALAEGFAAMGTDALVAGRPIHQPIRTNAQIDEAFDTITYGKGGHVVAMIAGYMGDTRFRDGVRRYMAAHKYGNATSQDFFAAMAEADGDPRIVPAMQSFTDQQGVPLVTFSGGEQGRYRISQSRYARLGASAPQTRWGVPLCLRRIGTAQQCQLLTEPDGEVTLPGKGPLVPNAGGTGYYRFDLPAKDWDRLIGQAGQLPGGEALALDDSLLASFRAGRASAAQLVALARQLAKNPDSYASDVGVDSLDTLARAGMLDAAAIKGYHRLVQRLYAPRLRALGFDPQLGAYAGEDPERSQQREQIVRRLAGTARDPALRQRLIDAARAMLAGDAKALDPAWYDTALAAWIDQGGLPAAQDLAGRALASQDPLLRPQALEAVAASGSPAIGRWVLDSFKDERLRSSERLGLIRSVIATAGTRDMGFDWLKLHFDDLRKGGGIFFAARLPGMVGGFCSAARADEIAALLRPQLAGQTGALELERTIERVRACGLLKDARSAEASAALKRE